MGFNLLADNNQNGWVTYVIMGVIVLLIIGLFVWQSYSNKKKQKEAQDMMNNLQIGDKIKTIGGVCGYLVEINEAENTITIETGCEGKKSYVKFDRNAIYQTGSANQNKPAQPKKEEKVEEVKEEVVEAKAEDKAEDKE